MINKHIRQHGRDHIGLRSRLGVVDALTQLEDKVPLVNLLGDLEELFDQRGSCHEMCRAERFVPEGRV